MAEVVNIATFDFDTSKITKSIEDYQARLFELGKEQKRYAEQNRAIEAQIKKLAETKQLLTNAGQQESASYKQVESEMKRLNTTQEQVFKNQKNLQIQMGAVRGEYNNAVKAQRTLIDGMGESIKATDSYTAALNREIRTKAEAKQNNIELIRLADQLDLSTESHVEMLKLLNEQIDRNTTFIKENSSGMQQQAMNVGNYQSALQDAAGNLNIFNGGLSGFASRAQEAGGATNLLRSSMTQATTAVGGLTKSFAAFIATPVGAVLAAIVAAFGLVRNAMNRSEESSKKMSAAFSAFSGIVQTVLRWLEPLGEFLIDGIVAGFEAAGAAAQNAMGLLADALDFVGWDSAADGVRGFNQEITEGIKGARDLAMAEAELEKSQRKARLTQLEYQKEAETFRQLRDDTTKSIAERIKANDALSETLDKQLQAELALAKSALTVANLRIQAEGRTKEALDAQYAAMTEIADIEERINGQRSEQLTNRVALEKEAQEAAQAAIDASITKQREELDLFLAQQGFRKKSLEEQLEFERETAKRSKEILDYELRNKRISREKHAAEVLKIDTELARMQAEIVVQNAQDEIDEFLRTQQQRLDERKRLAGDEAAIISEMEQARLDFARTQFEQGLIDEREYQAERLEIQREALTKQQELKKSFDEQTAADEKLARELETQARLDALPQTAWAEFEAKRIILDEQYAADQERLQREREEGVISEENYQAALYNVREQYARADAEIDRLKNEYKLDSAAQTAGNLATIAGKETAFGKAMAITQTTIDTYKSATAAYSSLSGIPIVGPVLGAIAAAAAVAAGLANVKKIVSTKTPSAGGLASLSNPGVQSFSTGGVVQPGIPVNMSNGDNTLVTAMVGETFLNPAQRRYIGDDVLNMAGVPGISPVSESTLGSNLASEISSAVYSATLAGTSQGAERGLTYAADNKTVELQATFK